jgi:sarcosine oxidase, subunit beta
MSASPAFGQQRYVIIGGGIMGLSIAYHLAKLGARHVLVLEKTYLCGGASGRNGGGVRAQWSSVPNVALMQESLQMCRDFTREMKINVWFRGGGYLFLVRTHGKQKALEASVSLQNEQGLRTRMLSAQEAQTVVPELNTEGIVAASYNADDGVVFPWPFVWGYAKQARALGVELRTFVEVTGIETQAGRVSAVRARQLLPSGNPKHAAEDASERIEADCVINACGAWSPEIAKMLGIALPNKPHRHEICSSEPLKPWLTPLVADLENGLYFSQSNRGEIVGGIGQHDVPEGINQESSSLFLQRYAKALVQTAPIVRHVKVLRQWAGCYDLTPDANPIVGFVDEVSGFYQASGFMGHGFMMAPIIGKMAAAELQSGQTPKVFESWNLRRFRTGQLLSESMIIG